MSVETYTVVAQSADLDEGALLGVVVDGTRVCLVRHLGRVFGLDDECPHQGYPLSSGELLDGGRVECPWHGAQFDCASGDVQQGPATDAVATWAVREVDGSIQVGPRRPPEA
jgi:nitrite reductase/ring-hydroxylating ferredoxin subunit